MRVRWILLSGCAILLALAAAGALKLRSGRVTPAPPKPAQPPAPAVFTGSEVVLTGRLEPRKVLAVAAPIEGTLDALFVESGQEVFEGQLLARVRSAALDSAEQAAAEELESVQSRLNNLESMVISARLEASRARADATRAGLERDRTQRIFERQSLLHREGATPRLTYEKAEQEYKRAAGDFESLDSLARAAEERLTSMQQDFDTTRKLLEDKRAEMESAKAHAASGEVQSPVDGIVVAMHGTAGEHVDPGLKDLVVLAVDFSELQVSLDAEPPVLRRIQGGEAALVQPSDHPGLGLEGTVAGIRNDRIVVEFTSPDPSVKPGLAAHVRIKLKPAS